jgi:hypothetical protein
MKNSLLIILCFALTACNPFADGLTLKLAKPSPNHSLEARLVYREINDPYHEQWVIQISTPKAQLSGWADVVIEFPIDYKIEGLNWKNDEELEIEYLKGSSELSLVDFRSPFHGVTITLKQK